MVDLKSLIAKLNPVCRQALEGAAGLCLSRTHYDVEIEHWLLKILERTNTDLDAIARHFEVNLSQVASDLTRGIDKFRTGNGRSPALSQNLVELAKDAWMLASVEYGEASVRSGHLILALVLSENLRNTVLTNTAGLGDISAEALKSQLTSITKETEEASGASEVQTASGGEARPQGPAGSGALGQYTLDLTAQARAGKIDPVLGRDDEIRQITDVLCRRRQNNPILTGEAGVGKTAVVEGFALKIAAGEVPPALKDVTLRALDLALLQAGAGMKGEFENRLKSVIEEVKSSPTPIILFIDEAHTMIGAGGQAGQGDAANLLKPALARGELRTIAATTWAEYKKYFERDAALARRFQVVVVDEPEEDSAIRMMQGLVSTLEDHHGVRILNEAVAESVRLSNRYITGRQLPDKSVSLLDTTCARIALSQATAPPALQDVRIRLQELEREQGILQREGHSGTDHQKRLAEIEEEKLAAETNRAELEERWQQELELVGKISELEKQLSPSEKEDRKQLPAETDETSENPVAPDQSALTDEQREEIKGQLAKVREELVSLQGESPLVHACCDGASVAATVAAWTGIPVGRMRGDEINTLMNMEALLEQSVVGQSHAMHQIAETIRTGRAKLTDPNRPVGVFLLAGTSGVGKTETALTLAELLFGGDQNLTTINMSEFKEEHKVSMLMGSPPGYIGYGEGGVLTEAVRRKPYSVLLLDEVEKAHPGVQDVFYQVFDKGHMKDGEGRDIYFRNSVIIMTSNAGTDLIKGLCSDPETMPEPEAFAEALQPELLKTFKPAFLGRVTTIPYYPLSPEVMAMIVRLKIGKIARRIAENYQAVMTYNDDLVNTIVDRCTEVDSGARNVDKILNQTMLPELSSEFLTCIGEGRPINTVHVDLAEDGQFRYVIE